MLSAAPIILPFAAYMLLLAGLAVWTERRGPLATALADSPLVYVLSLAVYCTSWTFYGSVGVAARSGFLFAAIYLGPTLVWLLGWTLVRRIARFKFRYRVSNLGDFLAARYGRTYGLPALATVLAVAAITPYVALQFKAILASFHIMLDGLMPGHAHGTVGVVELLVLAFVLLVTVVFGLRQLDPGQRQRGLMMVLAAESLVKLVAFLAAGVFVTYGLHGGFGDVLAHAAADPAMASMRQGGDAGWYLTFINWLMLSMAATLLLPRQFHVGVVELPRLSHLRVAMWAFPLYLLAISLFVYPVAAGGLLDGLPLAEADTFVLALPLRHGNFWLALLVFLGGFSAAVGMITVSAVTLSVMVANNLVMPLAEKFDGLRDLRRRGLQVRWLAVLGIVLAGYLFDKKVGESHFLAAMGIISFAGVAQLAPSFLIGLFWRQASRTGALWGLSAGFALWAYTLLLPAMARSGWLSPALLSDGPFGLAALRPEALFGLAVLPPVEHGVFWSLAANIALLVLGSCWHPASEAEREFPAEAAEGEMAASSLSGGGPAVDLEAKLKALQRILAEYLPNEAVAAAIAESLERRRLTGRRRIKTLELMHFLREVETWLAGAIGTATAHAAMRQAGLVSPAESEEIARIYSRILADLKLSPEELRQRVDYFQERNEIMSRHAAELSEKVEDLKREVAARAHAEAALRESEKRFRSMADSAPVMIWMSEADGERSYFNQAWLAFTGRPLAQELRRGWAEGLAAEERERALGEMAQAAAGCRDYSLEYRLRRHDGEYRWVLERGAPRLSAEGEVVGFIGSCVDISDMKAAAEALRRSRDELESLVAERTAELIEANRALTAEVEQRRRVEASLRLTQYSVDRAPDAVFWIDAQARLLYVNDAACRSLGYSREELLGMGVPDIDPEFPVEAWIGQWERLREQGARTLESVHVAKDGHRFPVEVSVNFLEFDGKEFHFAFVRDISERKRAEASLLLSYDELKRTNEKLAAAQDQLLQSEKMASIGQLAAGVAHEINNPIGFVNSNLGTLRGYLEDLLALLEAYRRLEDSPGDVDNQAAARALRQEIDLDYLRQDIPALMRETLDGVQRVRQIVKDLKDFSHVDEAEWQESDLIAGLNSTLNVVWNELKYKAQVVKEYGPLPPVSCIPSQINQVFMNLLVNAAQAIPEKGTITIRTGCHGDWVWVEVADTGAGIPPDNLTRIFEPFFTTKPVGKGTGLGLSVSYGIVKKHGGRIEVASTVGKGTTFRVWLPLARGGAAQPAGVAEGDGWWML